MNKTINLNIPRDASKRARLSVVRSILVDLLAHNLTIEGAATAIDDLIVVETLRVSRVSDDGHAAGRTDVGNDIGGI